MTTNPYDPLVINHGLSWYTEKAGISTACGSYIDRMTYDDTVARLLYNEVAQRKYIIGSEDCGTGTMGQISTQIQKFFIFLKGIKKYNDLYIQGTINKVARLQGNIRKFSSAIAGVLRSIIQRTRNWVLNKVKQMVRGVIDFFLDPLVKQVKEAVVDLMLDQIFCAFDRIIDSLVDMVGDFLYSLVGQIINAPFCAAERWTNALINRVVSDIDNALAPLFAQINDLMGGVARVAGSVMNIVNTILGFEGFFCKTPNCPEIQEFQASPWGGPTDSMTTNWNKFEFMGADGSGVTKTTDGWLEDFFGADSNTSQSPGDCYTGEFECGLPQIVIFGGGGSGAVAQAVVNNIGQVIGSNVLSGGGGYTSPPFVSIVDPAGCGNNASASSEINLDGEVTDIIINAPGTDYDWTYSGGAPVIGTFIGAPNPIIIGQTATLEWNVTNADEIGLSVPGFTSGLPLVGSVSVMITEDMVTLPPGAQASTVKFTLTASKNNLNSSQQTTTKHFVFTAMHGDVPTPGTNTLPPQIDSFVASPSTVSPGDLVTLSWETGNITSVSMVGTYIFNNETYSATEGTYPILPEDGSISFMMPTDIEFPPGVSSVKRTYILTAKNANAPVTSTGAVNEISRSIDVNISKVPAIPGSDPGIGTTGGGSTTPNVGVGVTLIGVSPVTGIGTTTITTGTPVTIGIGTGTSTAGIGTTTPGSGGPPGSGNNAVPVISTVDIISTGIGYTSGDTVTFGGGGGGNSGNAGVDANNGASADITVNNVGQIVDITMKTSGYGFTKIPNIRIDSKTGAGAEFRTRLKFIPVEQFLDDQNLQTVDPNKLVQVIDCPDKPLTIKIL